MAWYAYCIAERNSFPELCRHRRPTPLTGVNGLFGNQTFLFPASDLAVIVSEHTAELSAVPVWLFSSGPLGPPDHLIPARESADAEQMRKLVRARGHRVFAGRLERASLGFAERAAAKAVHAPEGDCRDWDAIDAFAGELASQLSPDKAAR